MCHPSTSLKALTQVRSHPQALAQCSRFFAESQAHQARGLLRHRRRGRIPGARKSPAAYRRHRQRLRRGAVRAQGAQAQPAEPAQQFHALPGRGQIPAEAGQGPGVQGRPAQRPRGSRSGARFKTSIAFMPARNQVGVLFNILGVFALRGIDLLKIESRPNPLSPFEYWFYVDFAGGAGEAAKWTRRWINCGGMASRTEDPGQLSPAPFRATRRPKRRPRRAKSVPRKKRQVSMSRVGRTEKRSIAPNQDHGGFRVHRRGLVPGRGGQDPHPLLRQPGGGNPPLAQGQETRAG